MITKNERTKGRRSPKCLFAKVICGALAALLLGIGMFWILTPNTEALANTRAPTIIVDGIPVVFPDAQPFVDANSRTLAPVRFIAEALGVEVYWDGERHVAEFTDGFTHVAIQIGSRNMRVSSPLHEAVEIVVMDTEAIIVDGRTFVPVRFLAEAYGAELGWDGENQAIAITTNRDGQGLFAGNPDPTTPTPTTPRREFNMNDPNVRAHPALAAARTAEELQSLTAIPRQVLVAPGVWEDVPILTWQSSAERIAEMQRDHPDYLIDGMTFYEWRMVPIKQWLDRHFATSSITMAEIHLLTDYQKTRIIRDFIEDGMLEEFIGLWRPGFRFGAITGRGDCVPIAQAIQFLMVAMDFELFRTIGTTVNMAHATNAYWDSTTNAIRFVDGNPAHGVWNMFVDEIAARGFIID